MNKPDVGWYKLTHTYKYEIVIMIKNQRIHGWLDTLYGKKFIQLCIYMLL